MSIPYLYGTEDFLYETDMTRDDRVLISVLRATRTPEELEELIRKLEEAVKEMKA